MELPVWLAITSIICFVVAVVGSIFSERFKREMITVLTTFAEAALYAAQISADFFELLPMKDVRREAPGTRLHAWLDVVGFFIPKIVREPFWEHVLSDRDAMVKLDLSPSWVRLAILSQFAILFVCGAWHVLLTLLKLKPRTPKD
jgi:hypothetical protein